MSWEKTYDADDNRALKQRLVEEGRAHAALVLDGDRAVAWCQYGSPDELPNIRHRKQYDETTTQPADYRITCIFIDREYRHRDLGEAAVRGAVDLIAQAGGGRLEAYPHDKGGKREAVLYSGTRAVFERCGFTYDRPKGKTNCVMYQRVSPAR